MQRTRAGATILPVACVFLLGNAQSVNSASSPPSPGQTPFVSEQQKIAWLRSRAYVSNRPDLSGMRNAERIQSIRNRLYSFLPRAGATGKLPQVHWVSALVYPTSGLLAEYSVTPQTLQWLLNRGRRVDQKPSEVLTELLRTGSITETAGLRKPLDSLSTGFNFIQHYPFTRLRHWPPSATPLKRMIVVRMKTKVRSFGIEAGTFYYHFVDPVGRRAFLLAN